MGGYGPSSEKASSLINRLRIFEFIYFFLEKTVSFLHTTFNQNAFKLPVNTLNILRRKLIRGDKHGPVHLFFHSKIGRLID